jgi:hypothetical protein
VWIFQELVLSKDPRVQYGHIRFNWALLYELSDFLMNKTPNLRPQFVFSLGPDISLQDGLNLFERISIVAQMDIVKKNKARPSVEKVHFRQSADAHGIEDSSKSRVTDAIPLERLEPPSHL